MKGYCSRNHTPAQGRACTMALTIFLLLCSIQLVQATYDPLINGTDFPTPPLAQLVQDYDDTIAWWRESLPVNLYEDGLGSVSDDKSIFELAENKCLHFGDDPKLLQQVRAAYVAHYVTDLDALSDIVRDPSTVRLIVPNVGVYQGTEAFIEYTLIANGLKNSGFATFVNREIVEKQPNFSSQDTLSLTQAQLTVWNNGLKTDTGRTFFDVHFQPCSVAVEAVEYRFDDTAINSFLEQRFGNRYLCERIQDFCTGENQQYDSIDDCISFMDILPDHDDSCVPDNPALPYSLEGNTTACRFLHHFMAQDEFTPDIHCHHVGKYGTVDPKGHAQCSTDVCSDPNKKTKFKVTNRDLEGAVCSDDWKAEAEQALVGALPFCLESIETGTCALECMVALRQFSLTGFKQSYDYTSKNRNLDLRARTCLCSQNIMDYPMSSVLHATPFSAANLLESCGIDVQYSNDDVYDAALDPCAMNSDTSSEVTSWTSNEIVSMSSLKDILANTVKKSIHFVNSDKSSKDEPDRHVKSMQMDVEFVKYHMSNELFLNLIPEIMQGGCPFYHGPVVGSYDDVVAILSKPQKRAPWNVLLNVDHTIDPNIRTITGTVFDTGSKEHTAIRAIFFDAFPVLSRSIQDIRDSTSKTSEIGGALSMMNAPELVVKYMFTQLFVDASESFVDQLTNIYVQGVLPFSSTQRDSALFHSRSGEGLLRVHRLLNSQAGRMMSSYIGHEKMTEYLELLGGNYTLEELSQGIAEQVSAGLGAYVAFLTTNARRLAENPCNLRDLFYEDPVSFVVESFRTLQLSIGGNNILGENDIFEMVHDGEQVVYSGRDEWLDGRPYAVQYSLSMANHDERVFPEPDRLDPSRPNLYQAVTFGAPEYTFAGGIGGPVLHTGTGARGCPAHNFMIAILVDVIDQVLSQDHICYEKNHPTLFQSSVVVAWILSGLVMISGFAFFILIAFFTQPKLLRLANKMTHSVRDDETDPSSFLSKQGKVSTCSYKLHLRNVGASIPSKISSSNDVEGNANKAILTNVSCDLSAGRLTAIMGQSGAGKSSLLNAIAKTHAPGTVVSGDIYGSTNGVAAPLDSVGYVYHDHTAMLFDELTGIENLVIGSILRTQGVTSWKDHFEEQAGSKNSHLRLLKFLVHSMKLKNCLHTPVKEMSSGEKRRMCIAVECMKRSQVLLLDEPLSGLDSAVAMETIDLLKSMAIKMRMLVILIIHQPSTEIFEELDDLILMKNGHCVYTGPCDQAVSKISDAIHEHHKDSLDTMYSLDDASCDESFFKVRSNPADTLLDMLSGPAGNLVNNHIIVSEEEQMWHSNALSRNVSVGNASRTDVLTTSCRDMNEPSLAAATTGSGGGLVPFQHRFMTCIWVGLLELHRDKNVLLVLFAGIPLVLLLVAGFNVGPNTEVPEAIIFIAAMVCGPVFMLVIATGAPRASSIWSYVHMKKSHLYSGFDYTLQLFLQYSILGLLVALVVYPLCLYVSLGEVLTFPMLMDMLGIAFSLIFCMVSLMLLGNFMVSNTNLTQHKFYVANLNSNAAVLVYLAIGWAFSGLLFRNNKTELSFLYDTLSVVTPAYWAGMSFFVTVFDGAVFAGCGVDDTFSCYGDTVLLYFEVDRQRLIPGLGIWILLLGAGMGLAMACLFAAKPWVNSTSEGGTASGIPDATPLKEELGRRVEGEAAIVGDVATIMDETHRTTDLEAADGHSSSLDSTVSGDDVEC